MENKNEPQMVKCKSCPNTFEKVPGVSRKECWNCRHGVTLMKDAMVRADKIRSDKKK